MINLKDFVSEGKWTMKGKYLAKDGGTTSIPGPYDNDAVVVCIKNDTFNLYKGFIFIEEN